MKKEHPVRIKILRYLKENPQATIRDIQKAMKQPSTSVTDYHLTKLQARGLLGRISKWVVITIPDEGTKQ